MTVATVKVNYVNPPKAGQRSGSINVNTDDPGVKYIGVRPSDLHQFTVGTSYLVEYRTKVSESTGRAFHDLVKLLGTRGAPGGAPKPNGHARSGQVSGQADKETSRHMFITGVVGRAMGSGKFDASQISTLTMRAAEAYEVGFGEKRWAHAEEPFNDRAEFDDGDYQPEEPPYP